MDWILRFVLAGVNRSDEEESVQSYRIPKIKNSSKYPKDQRPPHLQDDDIFDSMSIDAVTSQIGQWSHTKAIQETNAIKAKKNEKTNNKTNTEIKKVKIEAGEDDSTFQVKSSEWKCPELI